MESARPSSFRGVGFTCQLSSNLPLLWLTCQKGTPDGLTMFYLPALKG
jgi:hypothetical protein